MEQIHIKEVAKQFGKHTVLSNVNFTIEEGDVLGIIGKSGSGKTTLLNMISGLIHPSNGEITYQTATGANAKNLHKSFSKIKKHIGYMPQHTSFYPKLTVKENLLHFGKLYGLKKATLINNAKNLLFFTELYKHQDKLAHNLSGGMKKRLDLSCALIHKPKLLILDEPTSDLDPVLQQEIMSLIKEVNKQGVTVIIASHHLEGLEQMCTKLAIINEGTLHTHGAMEDVQQPFYKEPMTITVKAGKDKQALINHVKQLPVSKIVDQGHQLVLHTTNPEHTFVSLLHTVQKENLSFHDIDLRKPSLHEIFTRISRKQ